MNIIKQHKALVCLPPRQATRAIGSFFINNFEMVDAETGEARATHNARIPQGCEDYTLVMSMRNPYERYLSIIAWKKKIDTWDGDYGGLAYKFGNFYMDHYRLKDQVDYWVRTENIADDLAKIPFVKERSVELKDQIDSFNWINPYKSSDRSIDALDKYHTEIYENTKWVFDLFDYKKDSYLDIKS